MVSKNPQLASLYANLCKFFPVEKDGNELHRNGFGVPLSTQNTSNHHQFQVYFKKKLLFKTMEITFKELKKKKSIINSK